MEPANKQSTYWTILASISILILSGCGASAGTGYNIPTTANSKNLTIQEILAVDDKIVGASIRMGSALDTQGNLIPLALPQIQTSQDGKTSRQDLSIPISQNLLFIEASGGTSGNETLGANSKFLGVVEIPASGTVPRVNINPFTTMVAYAKSKQTQTPISQLASEALQPFLFTTQTAVIDINSSQYLGNTSNQVEVQGDAPLFQLFNEMIKAASKNEAESTVVDKTSSFLKKFFTGTSQTSVYPQTNSTFFVEMSSVSSLISTNPNSLGSIFSEAFSVLLTSTTAGTRPTTFATSPTKPIDDFEILPQILIDNQAFSIGSPVLGVSPITTSDSSGILLSSLPNLIRMQRTSENLTYKPLLTSQMQVLLEVYSTDLSSIQETLSVTIIPIEVQAQNNFTLVFPVGALLSGKRTQLTGTAQATLTNSSEDRYPSQTGTIDFPVDEFLAQARQAAGSDVLPSLSGRTINLEIKFNQNVKIRLQSQESILNGFHLERARIQ